MVGRSNRISEKHKYAPCAYPACLLLVLLNWTIASAVSGVSIWPRATPGTPAVLWSWHEWPECIRKHCPACVCSLQPGDAHLHPPFCVKTCCCTALRVELLVLYQAFSFQLSCVRDIGVFTPSVRAHLCEAEVSFTCWCPLLFCYNGLKVQLEKWERDTKTAKYQE